MRTITLLVSLNSHAYHGESLVGRICSYEHLARMDRRWFRFGLPTFPYTTPLHGMYHNHNHKHVTAKFFNRIHTGIHDIYSNIALVLANVVHLSLGLGMSLINASSYQ